MGQLKTQLNKKVGGISAEIAMVNNKVGTLDDKLNELHGSQQRLPSVLDIEKAVRNVVKELLGKGGSGDGADGFATGLLNAPTARLNTAEIDEEGASDVKNAIAG